MNCDFIRLEALKKKSGMQFSQNNFIIIWKLNFNDRLVFWLWQLSILISHFRTDVISLQRISVLSWSRNSWAFLKNDPFKAYLIAFWITWYRKKHYVSWSNEFFVQIVFSALSTKREPSFWQTSEIAVAYSFIQHLDHIIHA